MNGAGWTEKNLTNKWISRGCGPFTLECFEKILTLHAIILGTIEGTIESKGRSFGSSIPCMVPQTAWWIAKICNSRMGQTFLTLGSLFNVKKTAKLLIIAKAVTNSVTLSATYKSQSISTYTMSCIVNSNCSWLATVSTLWLFMILPTFFAHGVKIVFNFLKQKFIWNIKQFGPYGNRTPNFKAGAEPIAPKRLQNNRFVFCFSANVESYCCQQRNNFNEKKFEELIKLLYVSISR